MKRILMLIFTLCIMVLVAGCSPKYKRISFNDEYLRETITKHLDSNTEIINSTSKDFANDFTIYEISEREITDEEFQQVLRVLDIDEDELQKYYIKKENNKITGNLANMTDYSRGYYDMTDKELEKIAWDTFKKLPFIEGTYEYLGIQSKTTMSDSEGTHITRAGVSFRKLLDDSRVVGNDQCYLYFDGSGLVEFHIELYEYNEIGKMEMLSLDDALKKLKTPDAFTIDPKGKIPNVELGKIDTLNIDNINLLYVNQYSKGCKILQPVYTFSGVAADVYGIQTEFSANIIAIPETNTFE